MLNYIWGGMIIVAIAYGICTGNIDGINEGILDSSKEAITLCISMVGIMCLWMGIMEIALKAGIITKISKAVRPVLVYIFPGLKENDKAIEYIAANFAANILGLGWAATPMGLKAMKEMKKSSDREDGVASDEMCTFLVINISSLQLVPITIIAYRNQYGSVEPTAVIGPGMIASSISTFVGIIFCLYMTKRRKRK